MFKPTEIFISASAAATIAFSGMPRGEALISTNNQKQESTTTSHIFKNTLKNLRIAQEFLPFDPEPTFIPFDPEPTFVPFEPTYPTYDPRENIKGYQARDFEFALGYVDESAMHTNCREVVGESGYASEMYEANGQFKCNKSEYSREYIYTRSLPFTKQILCERMAAKNYKYLALSRNLKGPTLLGGYYDESSQQCFAKINAHE